MGERMATGDGSGLAGTLRGWLLRAALPLWANAGVDPRGGFVEALGLDGQPLQRPRRARVQPRQVFVFAHAQELGWPGDGARLARQGLDYIERCFGRPDGFYRTLVTNDGKPADDTALLYDQAFVLLGLAAAAGRLEEAAQLHARALALRERIARHWRVAPGEFLSGEIDANRRDANPHMHLLEACMAWAAISPDPVWRQWVDEIVDLALERFVDAGTGALFEGYDARWLPGPDAGEPSVEPGHQYEWAWLLLRSSTQVDPQRRRVALQLIDLAEHHGVHAGVAVNVLDARLGVRDGGARLWVQTERLRACNAAHGLTGDARYARAARAAQQVVLGYLDTEVAGLWFDARTVQGERWAEVVHASTLYHIVSAALDLQRTGIQE